MNNSFIIYIYIIVLHLINISINKIHNLTLLASITFALHAEWNHKILHVFHFFTMANKIAHNSENTNIMNIKVTRILNKT